MATKDTPGGNGWQRLPFRPGLALGRYQTAPAIHPAAQVACRPRHLPGNARIPGPALSRH